MKLRVMKKYKSAHYVIYAVEHYIRFRAKTRFGVYPISFQWSLEGKVLKDEGSIRVNKVQVRYKVNTNRCELWTKLGSSIITTLGLNATDSRGQKRFSCIPIRIIGIEKQGGRQSIQKQKSTLEFLVKFVNQAGLDLRLPQKRPPAPKLYDPREEFRRALVKGMGVDIKNEDFQ